MSPLIIVVDDDKAARVMFALLGQDQGWMVKAGSYADITLTMIQQFQPELVVLDFSDPHIGQGWEFLQLLKMEESTAAVPVLIAATTQALPSEMAAFLASHSISVIAKPVDVKHFVVVARQILSRQSTIQLISTKRLPILIVEDNDDISSGFMLILEMEGYLAMTVPDGQLALDAVKNGRHSLIFLDIQMPVMDGIEFMKAYAQLPPPHTPVIICSAEPDLSMETFPPFVIGRLKKPFLTKDMLVFVSKYAEPV